MSDVLSSENYTGMMIRRDLYLSPIFIPKEYKTVHERCMPIHVFDGWSLSKNVNQ